MADENTTDSEPTPTPTPAAPDPAPETPTPSEPNPDTSTTDPTPSPEGGETILTGNEPETPEAPDTRTDEQKAADAARDALFGAPDGDYEITGLPEGTVIDTAALEAIVPVAKQLNLSNEGLSKLAATYTESILPGVTQQVTDTIMAQAEAQRADWGKAAIDLIKTDPAFGGAPLKDVQAASAKAIERFGGTELRQYLDDTGLGNHPAMVKAFFLAGSAISEDTTFERGNTAPNTPQRKPGQLNKSNFYPTS